MARYIDADVIKDELQGARIIKKPKFLNADEALFIIDNQPTADVEDVVRCKDCGSYNKHYDECTLHGSHFGENGFCCKGKRMKERF